jgi:nitrogen regulatory protein P-II 1
MVESSRGTTRHVAEYNEVDSIVTIIDESEVDAVIAAIVNASGTGSKGDGKIFVSKVDEVIDIGSKQKGSLAL